MDNELIAAIVAVLLAAAGCSALQRIGDKVCPPNPPNGANCTDLSSGKIEWNYHFGIN